MSKRTDLNKEKIVRLRPGNHNDPYTQHGPELNGDLGLLLQVNVGWMKMDSQCCECGIRDPVPVFYPWIRDEQPGS
jgi:hypothetical protein